MIPLFGSVFGTLLPDPIKQKAVKATRKVIVAATSKVSPKLSEVAGTAIDTSQRLSQSARNGMEGVAKATLIDGIPLTIGKQVIATAHKSRGTHRGAQVEACQLGDHLKRTGAPIPLYSHHAIYIGDGHVMHYAGPIDSVEIQVSTLEEFAAGQYVTIVSEYESALLVSREESVRRAWQRYSEHEYNLILNNCENFVRWCRAGD